MSTRRHARSPHIQVIRDIRRVLTCVWPECAAQPWGDLDLPLCPTHAAKVHLRVADAVPTSRADTIARRRESWYAQAGYVYFAKVGDLVKIGFTRDLHTRMRTLQGRMLTYAPGTMEDERDMHARFRECHERGEYFRPVGALATYLSQQATRQREGA